MAIIATLTFHIDPEHGWLEVPVALVRQSGIEVSSYSYQDGDTAYLEEDCDAPRFLDWIAEEHETPYIFERYHLEEAFIRDLPTYGG